ncbi:hypothetical protein EYC80_003492 [Monilinia laxa]|uniref:Uncharacterized protein n=1 Tax=Monilinia laxa TaxID=61186 RepID=A0A5N6KE44_MONLA|nr:hypothetical protein EYC80_003492 [Monilinia laxa]
MISTHCRPLPHQGDASLKSQKKISGQNIQQSEILHQNEENGSSVVRTSNASLAILKYEGRLLASIQKGDLRRLDEDSGLPYKVADNEADVEAAMVQVAKEIERLKEQRQREASRKSGRDPIGTPTFSKQSPLSSTLATTIRKTTVTAPAPDERGARALEDDQMMPTSSQHNSEQ